MTLMEVILAIAILGGALAVLGELVRVGTRSCRRAEAISSAQLLADSLITEICTDSSTTPESTEGIVEQFGGRAWTYTIDVQPATREGLLVINVHVTENLEPSAQPVTYSLARWLIDPQLEMELEEAAASMASEPQASGSGSADTSDDSSNDATATMGGGR